jgi:hypothetical protein
MSLASLDRLASAQSRLIAALDGGDIAEIEGASRALAAQVEEVRAVAVWRATPELKQQVETALRSGESARVRIGYLADRSRRRLQALLGLGGRATMGYGRNGRIRLPGA